MELFTLTPSRKQRQELIDNILGVYDAATPEQRARGMAWYRNAHDLGQLIANGDADKGAGVIAALSANTSWEQNLKMATAKCAGQEIKGLPLSLTKAERIMKGEPVPAVLGKGLKTLNFYMNIRNPDGPVAVTIDRHAHDLARGEAWGDRDRGLSAKGRYRLFMEAYRDAAALRNILPCEMQAVTWTAWREGEG